MSAQPFGLFERMLAGRYLRAKRQHGGVALISVISVTAITLAVMALIITMSVMNGFRETLLSRILGVDGHVFADVRNMPGSEIERLMEVALSSPNVLQAAPIINAQALATSDGMSTGVVVRGISREALERIPLVADSIQAGGFTGFEGVEAPTILIGDRLANALGVREGMAISIISPQGFATPFGLTMRRKAFLVGGIFSVGMEQFDSGLIYMPLEQAQVLFSRGDGADELELRVRDPDRQTRGTMMDLRDRFGPQVFVYDWQAKSQGLSDALMVERNVMRLILMILVAIAALNIVTGLIMLVKNKSRDIAILRTMGATKGAVQRVFFMASASLGVIGLVLGLLLGLGFCLNIEAIQNAIQAVTGFDVFPGTVYSLETLPAQVEWGEVVLVSFFTILVTFASTLTTAWWASRLDPVEALRYE